MLVFHVKVARCNGIHSSKVDLGTSYSWAIPYFKPFLQIKKPIEQESFSHFIFLNLAPMLCLLLEHHKLGTTMPSSRGLHSFSLSPLHYFMFPIFLSLFLTSLSLKSHPTAVSTESNFQYGSLSMISLLICSSSEAFRRHQNWSRYCNFLRLAGMNLDLEAIGLTRAGVLYLRQNNWCPWQCSCFCLVGCHESYFLKEVNGGII